MTEVSQHASSVWERVMHFAAEIRESDFMEEMTRHLDQPGGHGLMGALDCATLYGLTRWRRPTVVAETGGYLGMSSAFILKRWRTRAWRKQSYLAWRWTRIATTGR
jgi:predicted O-methyltransferase YrrM